MIKTKISRILYRLGMGLKPLFVKFLSFETRQRLKKKILKSAFPIEKSGKKLVASKTSKGINLIGYNRAEMGIGESCRIAAKSLSAADIPFGIINFTGTNRARMTDLSWTEKEIDSPIFNVNIFHINAEQMTEVYASYGNSIFQNRYNIGYWAWELPDFPDEWCDSFQLLDEIWVPSTFVNNSIAIKSPIPVVTIPHSIEVRITQPRNRAYFKLPEDAFLFLSMYDVNSYQARKNPQASVEAFKRSFAFNDQSVGLVIKVNGSNANQGEMEMLLELVKENGNIYLIKETLSRNDINGLISVVDCFVSLHRSEGFGLGLAEAMYLHKPVIGTNWSSVTDFMNDTNSCPVNYTLVQVGKDYGPYKSYQYWADPDIENASNYMKKLVAEPLYYEKIADEGKRTIQEHFSPSVVGSLIQKRLQYIYLWKFGG
ncbi:glycosyltransferase [Paenibacillus polymyxa]|uniref:glycosyltransferase n=1 Tax=Paenibacillus polymyxa TaxID=1406 RepID=UPI002ED3C0AB|nr:glycosyltransferase [Paenibacillus polymyxa]